MEWRYKKWIWHLIVFAGVCINTTVLAGEEVIDEASINGLIGWETRSIEQGKRVELCFRSNQYAFSGVRNDNIYTVFFLTPKLNIDGSVGYKGNNSASDVVLIKKVLNKLNYYHGPLDGTFNNDMQNAIERVQRELLVGVQPDGLISTAGQTIRALRIAQADSLFIRLNQKKEADEVMRFKISNCVNFFAPNRVDHYDIYYNELSYIIDYAVGKETSDKVTVLNSNEERLLKKHLYRYSGKNNRIGKIWVKPKHQIARQPFTTYLQVNGKDLVLERGISPGFSKDPLVLSWYNKPNHPNQVQYQYRMSPEDDEWTPWSTNSSEQYLFLNKGPHLFEVRTRYKDAYENWQIMPAVSYDFDLERAFVSPIDKGIAGRGFSANLSSINIDNIYRKSYALLIGVDEFKDSRLTPLSYMNKDILSMKSTLSKLGFQVETLIDRPNKQTIVEKIRSFTHKINADDRIIIYISSHGFSYPAGSGNGYIAAHDCITDEKGSGCLELNELKTLLTKIEAKLAHHVLVILDTCSSGLGIITKDLPYQEIRIVTKTGSHMLTAGMADQKAQMDHQLGMSTFTHYLAKGLAGEADIIEDGVISLSELLLYVRFQVAKWTDGEQTPMMGRLSGAGEMIFKQ